MALQFVLGGSGSGKSTYLYQHILDKSREEPDTGFFIVVPEQFTMQTQRELVSRQENHGIMNIDVVSFQRLAYRVFDELGLINIRVLEETGKNFVLRRVAEEKQDQLGALKGNLKKPGYINELKSVISELAQYRVTAEQLSEFLQDESQPAPFRGRLADIQTMYQGFLDYLKEDYVTAEEVLEVLARQADRSNLLKNSVMVLDGFTGFTPIQYYLLEQLMPHVRELYVAVTVDQKEDVTRLRGMQELFYMSKKTVLALSETARRLSIEISEPVLIEHGPKSRFGSSAQLEWLEQNLFRRKSRVYQGQVTDIALYGFAAPRQELLFAAGEIRRLVREEGFRYQDIALVCGDVTMYGNYVEEVFGSYEIPYFLDKKSKITFHPLTELVRNFLLMLEQDFSYESVFACLRCGLNDMERSQIDLLENYVLANRIRGFSSWKKKWVRLMGVNSAEELILVNECREKFLESLSGTVEELKNKNSTVLQKTVALYEYLLRQHVEQKLEEKKARLEETGREAAARECGQMYKIVMDLLDKLTQLLGEEVMVLKEYRQLLEAGFEAAAVGIIPPGFDQVVIGDIERSRLSHVKALFFVGVNDGLIPKKSEQGGLISQQERELLAVNHMELAPGVRERSFIQKFYLYLNLTKPSKKLYLTWFLRDGSGKEARRSYLVYSLIKMFPRISIYLQEDANELFAIVTPRSSQRVFIEGLKRAKEGEISETFRALYHWYLGNNDWAGRASELVFAAFSSYESSPMHPELTRDLYGSVLENSVTRLERFSACAFSHFLAYGIGLSQRELGEFAPVDLGSMFHEALECYSRKMEESGFLWFDVPEGKQEELLEAAVEEAVSSVGALLYGDAATAYTVERVKRILRCTVMTIGRQVKESSFSPEGYEVSFSFAEDLKAVNFTLSDEEKMRLRGRIDRVDVKEVEDNVYVKVIDYKSGNTKFQLISLYHGLQLQLVVYLNAAVELMRLKYPGKDIRPAGMFYYHIDDPVIDVKGETAEEEIREKVFEQLKLNGVGIENGDSSVSKKSRKADEGELKLLSNYVNHKIRSIGKDIYQGNIEVSPYLLGQETGCDYCPYHGICGFDGKMPGYGYRRLSGSRDEEVILEKMRREVEQDEE